MGDWSSKPATQQWTAFYDTAWGKAATLEQNGTWAMRSIVGTTRRGWQLSEPEQQTTIDASTFIPADTERLATGTLIMREPKQHLYRTAKNKKSPQTWTQYIDQLPEWERTLLHDTWETESHFGLAAELRNDTSKIIIVSDGGQAGPRGTFFISLRGLKSAVLFI